MRPLPVSLHYSTLEASLRVPGHAELSPRYIVACHGPRITAPSFDRRPKTARESQKVSFPPSGYVVFVLFAWRADWVWFAYCGRGTRAVLGDAWEGVELILQRTAFCC